MRKGRLAIWAWIVGLILATFGNPFTAHSELNSESATESDIKAAYIFNFTKFIQWPSDAFENTDSPIVIGILGKTPTEKILVEILKDEKVRNRPLVVKSLTDTSDLSQVHVLYITPTSGVKMDDLPKRLKNFPTLTIGEREDFCRTGGCINFYMEGKAVRFEMNPSMLKQSRLQGHSRLLKLAKIVETPAK